MFQQPSGSDEGADAITLLRSQKWLRMGSIRSSAALPRIAVRGRAFLSEHPNDNWSRYNKDGLSEAKPIFRCRGFGRWVSSFGLYPAYLTSTSSIASRLGPSIITARVSPR